MAFGNGLVAFEAVHIDNDRAKNGCVDRAIALFYFVAVLAMHDIFDPVQAVLNVPPASDALMEVFGPLILQVGDVKSRLGVSLVLFPCAASLHPHEPTQALPLARLRALAGVEDADRPVAVPPVALFVFPVDGKGQFGGRSMHDRGIQGLLVAF